MNLENLLILIFAEPEEDPVIIIQVHDWGKIDRVLDDLFSLSYKSETGESGAILSPVKYEGCILFTII